MVVRRCHGHTCSTRMGFDRVRRSCFPCCRLQPFRSRTGGSQAFGLAGAVAVGAESIEEDVDIDCSADVDDPTVFASPRERRLGGMLLTNTVQAVGRAGLPQAISDLVNSSPTNLSITWLRVCLCV
jgi:hypothetical protein